MKKTILFTVIAFGIMSFMTNNESKRTIPSPEKEKKEGWVLLFDGTTMNGWRSYKNKESEGWDVKNGRTLLQRRRSKEKS